jgi:N6-adenosine-specific RNA methylase IME4
MKLDREVLRKLPLALRVEIEENAQRKPLTQSELAVEQRRILAELRKHKTPGARTDLNGGTPETKFSEVRATTFVGRLFNESHKTVERRLAIADSGDSKLIRDMDRSGRVSGVFKRLIVKRQAAQIRAEPPPLPGRGPYRVIVADPPWKYEREDDPSNRSSCPFPPMSLDEICAMPVASIAAPDCILWLWTTNRHMLNGTRQVLDAWGFEPETILTWVKVNKFGTGSRLRGKTEHCVLAKRGKPLIDLTNESTVLFAPAREHSRKPEEFYPMIEKLCPAPRYAELFARAKRKNWDGHGNDVGKFPAEAAE